MSVEYRQEWLAQPWDTPQDRALRTLAREYHERTEAFDQAYCRARDQHGFAVPLHSEWLACNDHALAVLHELKGRCRDLGLDATRLREAISSEARHFEADWINRSRQSHLDTPARPDPSPLPLRACGAVGTLPATLSIHP